MFVGSFRALRAVGGLKSARTGWAMGPVMFVRSVKAYLGLLRCPIEFHSVMLQYDSGQVVQAPGSSLPWPQRSLYLKGNPQK